MRIVVLLCSLITLASLKIVGQSSGTANFKCVLTSDKSTYGVGEQPKFSIRIVNESATEVYLIGSLDGSDVKMRMPHCYYKIEAPQPDTLRYGRCGNMNGLRVEDFVLIKSGESFDPYMGIDGHGFFQDHAAMRQETFAGEGEYKIRFHYSTISNKIDEYLGDKSRWEDKEMNKKIRTLFSKVPKIELESNEIVIMVKK